MNSVTFDRRNRKTIIGGSFLLVSIILVVLLASGVFSSRSAVIPAETQETVQEDILCVPYEENIVGDLLEIENSTENSDEIITYDESVMEMLVIDDKIVDDENTYSMNTVLMSAVSLLTEAAVDNMASDELVDDIVEDDAVSNDETDAVLLENETENGENTIIEDTDIVISDTQNTVDTKNSVEAASEDRTKTENKEEPKTEDNSSLKNENKKSSKSDKGSSKSDKSASSKKETTTEPVIKEPSVSKVEDLNISETDNDSIIEAVTEESVASEPETTVDTESKMADEENVEMAEAEDSETPDEESVEVEDGTTDNDDSSDTVTAGTDYAGGDNGDNKKEVSGKSKSLAQYFCDIAYKEIGVEEEKYNVVKYNDWYYGKSVKGTSTNQYAWCAVFVAWCANKAGIDEAYIPKIASAERMRTWFRQNGGYHSIGSYTPQPGDIVFYAYEQAGRASHVGIVYSVEKDTIYTVEGNSKDAVRFKTRSYSGDDIVGFAHPACFN